MLYDHLFYENEDNLKFCHYGYNHILLHVPHSAKLMPLGDVHDYLTDEFRDLTIFSSDLIDWYADELFVPSQDSFLIKKDPEVVSDPPITAMVFDVCRTLCDVEQLPNDSLEEKGFGIIYNSDYTDKLEKSKIEFLKRKYLEYRCKISTDLLAHSKTLLIDCHSFSSTPNVLFLDANRYNVDICIGYNKDNTKPNKVVIDYIEKYFRLKGYKVGKNRPFSGSKKVDFSCSYSSIKIAIRKSLYMDEQTLEKNNNFNKLKEDIQTLFCQLLDTSKNIDSVFYENYVLFSTYVIGKQELSVQRSLSRIMLNNKPKIMACQSFTADNIMATESIEERIKEKKICTETKSDLPCQSGKSGIINRSCEEDLNDVLALCILKRDIKYILPYLAKSFYISLNLTFDEDKKVSFLLDRYMFAEMMTKDFLTMDNENIDVYYVLHNDYNCDTSRILVARQDKETSLYKRESYKLFIKKGKIQSMRYINDYEVSETMFYNW